MTAPAPQQELFPDLRESPLCTFCGQRLVPSGATTGGGTLDTGETICFDCCAFLDAITMSNTEPGQKSVVPFYVTDSVRPEGGPQWVANWPGTLKMLVHSVTSWRRGGFGSKRRTVHFRGPNGSSWSGIEYNGNAGSLLRGIRRLKP